MNDAMLLLDIGPSAGALPTTTPAPVRYGTWFPVPHQASPIPPVNGATPTPVADGVLLEWTPADQPDVEYKIERAPNASGPWTEIARVSEPRYLVSDPSGATWHYRITPLVRGKAGAPVTLEGAAKQAPSVADLVAQQAALDAEVLARTQGDLQTALEAAADAQTKADAALANASEQTDAALAQALAAANAALTTATAQTDALAAEVAEIVNAPEWEAEHAYITGWLVRHNNALYRASTETTGQPPDQHPAVWEHLGQYSSVAGIAAAALSSATTNASDLAAEVTRINALVARMPGGSGKLATQASVNQEQTARVNGDSANAQAIQAVTATVTGKADASVVQSLGVRVSGLEAAGSNSNLLSNTTFDGGTRLWFKGQKNSTWTAPAVDQSGDNFHPSGIHNLGIRCPDSTLADNTQWGQLYSASVPVVPGQRYLASCYIANHRCTARLYLFWYDGEDGFISSAGSPTLARKWSGLNQLATWHHAVAVGVAPANAARVKVIVRFHGDGGENPYGWIIRPMLEQARETQTEPSPWNPGGLETSAQLLIESERTDALIARMPAGTGKLAPEAAVVSEQIARISGDAANAGAISVEANRIDGVMARLPGGTGQLATQASVLQEQNARIAGDAANAGLISAVQSSVAGKADASVVQSMQTKVAGLEAAGHNSNLLPNTTFNSGRRLWFKGHSNSTWTDITVDQSGDNYHPPGIHNLGIRCPNSTLADNTQWGQIYSDRVPVIPGQRYLASSYVASHRCTARLYIFWYDAENIFISSVGSGELARKWSGLKNLNTWHHAVASGIAPSNATNAVVVVRFRGDGGENPYGWMIRPMLEQASENQTEPSPWNPGGMETSAEYTLAVQAGNLVSGLRAHNDGTVAGLDILATIFRILSPAGAPNGLELQNGTLRVWRGNAQRIIGNGFGTNADLMDYFGPNVGTANASKSNAIMWMDIHGNAWWGGDITSGPLKYSTHTAATQTVGLELINGPFPTNGNIRTVSLNFSRHVTYTKYAWGGGISLGAGSNTATIKVYRKIGDAAEVLWQTIQVTGSTSFNNEYDGPSIAWASWQGGKTVVDTSPSTDTVRYRAVITAFSSQAIHVTGGGFNQVDVSQSLKISSVEDIQ